MITKRISNLKIDVGKKSAFEYKTDTDLPKMHKNNLVICKRGSGKTVAMVNLVEKMKYDRIFIVSYTMNSNKEIF